MAVQVSSFKDVYGVTTLSGTFERRNSLDIRPDLVHGVPSRVNARLVRKREGRVVVEEVEADHERREHDGSVIHTVDVAVDSEQRRDPDAGRCGGNGGPRKNLGKASKRRA